MKNEDTSTATENEQPRIAEQAAPFEKKRWRGGVPVEELRAHAFPGKTAEGRGEPEKEPVAETRREIADAAGETDDWAEEYERRIYRGRTVTMLRRYLRYSIETGRLPSLLGREFFRARVTSYTVVTFEDRVIFVHDMEKCLAKLDEFSRDIIARHILQEHDQAATGKLLDCTERTVRTYIPIALDLLSHILLDVGLLERIESREGKTCQGGEEERKDVSDCECGKNIF